MILEYKNCAIHYTIEGKGSAIVLLHGFLETINMWNKLALELSKSHKVICIDLLGHGQTDCLGYVHTMDIMADAIFAVLNYLKIKKVHIIGHSMGGYVALAMAKKQPQLFNGLCLMNSTFEADTKERKALRTRAIKMAQTNYESLVRMSFTNLFSEESRLKYNQELDAALQFALKISVQSYIAAQEGMKLRPNYFEVFNTINCKKLIILGEKDSIIDSKKLINRIKSTSIDFIEFSEGHMSYIENSKELSHSIKQFVKQ